MKRKISTGVVTIAAFLALGTIVRLNAQDGQSGIFSHYRIIDLGNPLGGAVSSGNAINNLGWSMGTSNLPDNASEHAELWLYGLHLDLGTLGGPNSAVIFPNRNDRGQIVGIAETADMDPLGETWSCAGAFFPSVTHHICLGFAWQNGQMTALPALGGNNGVAAGNNNQGQIVGWAETSVHDSTCVTPQVLQFEAVVWGPQPGQILQLPPERGDADSAATSVNDQGQVVGISGACDVAVGAYSAKHAVLWQDGQPMDLGTLGGHGWNTPTSINNHGQVVGFANLPGDVVDGQLTLNFHAFLWTKDRGMRDLGTLPGDAISEALGINDQGQVVGVSFTAGFASSRAFIWQDGVMQDLNTLVAKNPSNLSLIVAGDINARGEITGEGFDTSAKTNPAFLAIPSSNSTDDQDASPAQAEATSNTAAPITLPPDVRDRLLHRLGLRPPVQ